MVNPEEAELAAAAKKRRLEIGAKLGKTIRYYRLRPPMQTQAELAELVGLSRAAIGSYESGKTIPDIPTVAVLAEALEISVAELTVGLSDDEIARDAVNARHELLPLPLVDPWDGSWPLNATYPKLYVSRDIASDLDCILIVMKDDSMHPYICRGDLLVIDPLARKPRSQELIVVRCENGLLVRQMKRRHRHKLLLDAHHSVELDDHYEVRGTVVGIAERRLKPLTRKLQLSPSDWIDSRSDIGR
jgi:transcriptional regulator with XRE-family HTH domain